MQTHIPGYKSAMSVAEMFFRDLYWFYRYKQDQKIATICHHPQAVSQQTVATRLRPRILLGDRFVNSILAEDSIDIFW